MGLVDIFRVLGNKNRRNILLTLQKKENHISALARELNIAVPVALRHIILLESVGLISKKKYGKTHVFFINKSAENKLKSLLNLIDEPQTVTISKNETLDKALEKISGIKIEHTKQGAFISSIDNNKGFFIFEVNGKLVSKSPDKIKINKTTTIELQRLSPIIGKKIEIKVE